MRRIPMINGWEYDALTERRRYLYFWHSKRSKIKRNYRRRERQLSKYYYKYYCD